MKKIGFLLLGILLAGCSLPAPSPIPPSATPSPMPTQTQAAPLATPTRAALATPTPQDTLPLNPARIMLLEPVQGARLTFPIDVRGYSEPTFEQNLGIHITGEDGRLLAEGYATIGAEMGQAGPFNTSFSLNITGEQRARISVFDVSARDGGLLYLTSVWVTLLPPGEAASPGQSAPQRESFFRIDQPPAYGEVSGGVIRLEGLSGPAFESTIVVTLCGEGGIGERDLVCGTQDNILLTVPVTIAAPDIGQPGTFSVDLPYSISQETFARVAVYVISPADGGITELNSVEVLLLP